MTKRISLAEKKAGGKKVGINSHFFNVIFTIFYIKSVIMIQYYVLIMIYRIDKNRKM